MRVVSLGLEEARRIAIRAQLLDADRPVDLLTMVDRLTFLQLDPTAAIAPSADIITWTRLGSAYQPAQLQRALEVERNAAFRRRVLDILATSGPLSSRDIPDTSEVSWQSTGWRTTAMSPRCSSSSSPGEKSP